MPVPWISLVAMTFALTSMVVAVAMFFLVLWQAPKRRANQLAALFMIEVVLWAAASLLLRMAGLVGANAIPFFYGIVLGIGFNGLFLFAMISQYAGLWRYKWPLALIAAGLLFHLTVIPGLFAGTLFTHFSITSLGELRFAFTPLGYVSFGVAYLFYLGSVAILWRFRSGLPGNLLAGGVVITVGVLVSIHPILSQYSIPIMTAGVTTVLFAHAILMENLFNPLALLNQDLTEANQQLSRLTNELRDANRRLSEASRLKSSFLASMSHELRTPLNSILGYSDMLAQGAYGPLNETQTDRIGIVIRNGKSLLQLISDILDLSKIEAGQLQLKVHPLLLDSVVEECLTVFSPAADKKGLALKRDLDASLWPALADRGRVLQVLSNLVSNAVKFTSAGSITVHVKNAGKGAPHTEDGPGSPHGWVLVIVEDTGVGITSEDQTFIFDEFRQGDETLTREYEGTGLGLAISRHLVQMMSGKIWVESQPGKGSRFFVLLPAAPPDRAEVAGVSSSAISKHGDHE